MAIKPGYRRLKEFDCMPELSEAAKESLDIPEDAEVIKIINEFRNGGPMGVAYTRRGTEEQRKKNRHRLQNAIDEAFDAIIERHNEDAEYYENLKKELGMCC